MMILRNHGILTVGCDVPETTYLYFLMKACEIQARRAVARYTCPPNRLSTPRRINQLTRQDSSYLARPSRLLDAGSPGYNV